MTAENIEKLKTDLANKTAECNSLRDYLRNLTAERDASKQMVAEVTQTGIQARSNLLLFQQANQQFVAENNELKKQIEAFKQQVLTLSAKILELENEKAKKPDLHVVPECEQSSAVNDDLVPDTDLLAKDASQV